MSEASVEEEYVPFEGEGTGGALRIIFSESNPPKETREVKKDEGRTVDELLRRKAVERYVSKYYPQDAKVEYATENNQGNVMVGGSYARSMTGTLGEPQVPSEHRRGFNLVIPASTFKQVLEELRGPQSVGRRII